MGTIETVILFTGSFPYSIAAEHTFLNLEVKELRANFERIIIIPSLQGGERVCLPSDVEVDESYAINQVERGKFRTLSLALYSLFLYHELVARPVTLVQQRVLKSLIKFASDAENMRRWVVEFITRKNLDLRTCLFYTYWLDSWTTAIGLTKQKFPEISLVSRAHGYDLYEYRRHPPYIPYRAETLKLLDRLFLISEDGKKYIADKYPWFADRCETSRLGVGKQPFMAAYSKDGSFRIVSCSFVVPVKRLNLLLEGVVCAAQLKPTKKFEWHHIGDGVILDDIKNQAAKLTLPNLRCYFHGSLSNGAVLAFYKNNPVDVFINVSQSEGISVAMMEAQSCGIPIIATKVGGTPEIVSDSNGILLEANPTPEAIADASFQLLDNELLLLEKKELSQKMWQDRFNAEQNFRDFAKKLRLVVN